jgi:hypothetical protein
VINIIPGCRFRASQDAELVGMDVSWFWVNCGCLVLMLGEYVADYAYHERDLEGNYEPESRSDSPNSNQRSTVDPEKAATRTRITSESNSDTISPESNKRSVSRGRNGRLTGINDQDDTVHHGGREVSEGGVKPEGLTGRESKRQLEGMAQQR